MNTTPVTYSAVRSVTPVSGLVINNTDSQDESGAEPECYSTDNFQRYPFYQKAKRPAETAEQLRDRLLGCDSDTFALRDLYTSIASSLQKEPALAYHLHYERMNSKTYFVCPKCDTRMEAPPMTLAESQAHMDACTPTPESNVIQCPLNAQHWVKRHNIDNHICCCPNNWYVRQANVCDDPKRRKELMQRARICPPPSVKFTSDNKLPKMQLVEVVPQNKLQFIAFRTWADPEIMEMIATTRQAKRPYETYKFMIPRGLAISYMKYKDL